MQKEYSSVNQKQEKEIILHKFHTEAVKYATNFMKYVICKHLHETY